MTDLNNVVMIGNLVKDVEISKMFENYTKGVITIAVNRTRKNGEKWVEDVNFFDVTIWGKTAENLQPYLVKGQKVAVDGYLKQDRWEKDGQKFSRIFIVADNIQLIGARKVEQYNNNNQQNSYVNNQVNNNYQNNYQNKQNYNNMNNANVNNKNMNHGGFVEDIPF